MITGQKYLYVTAGAVGIVGCAGIDINKADTFNEGIRQNAVCVKECYYIEMLLFIVLSILMVMLGALLQRVFTYGQGEGNVQGQDVRAECTCADTQEKACRFHDYPLLWELSRNLPNEDHLFGIGLYLHVDNTEIEASRVDNKSIIRAVYVMLCKWYRTQDGLGKNSNGLEELKGALYRNNVGNLVQTVIQKHFDER